MSEFTVPVVKIESPVEHHPNADRLSLIHIGGYICISAKLEDGRHRYNQGDLVVYVPEGSVVPEWLLKHGFWDNSKGKGILAGSKGDRVKAIRLRGTFSQGIIFPVNDDGTITDSSGIKHSVSDGQDVSEILGIIKYEPPIPTSMSGEVMGLHNHTKKYDVESIQRITDLFTDEDLVIATEKVHGTNVQIGYNPSIPKHGDLFHDGHLYVGSKGLAGKGLVFKNNEKNSASNLYVRVLNKVLEDGFGENIQQESESRGDVGITLFGEVYGRGVQDLAYGKTEPDIIIFDIMIGNEYVNHGTMLEILDRLGLPAVPTLYEGRFDLQELEKVRDGLDTLSKTNIREGIVIRDRFEGRHPVHGRKVGKWVSPDYLTRKGGTEFN